MKFMNKYNNNRKIYNNLRKFMEIKVNKKYFNNLLIYKYLCKNNYKIYY